MRPPDAPRAAARRDAARRARGGARTARDSGLPRAAVGAATSHLGRGSREARRAHARSGAAPATPEGGGARASTSRACAEAGGPPALHRRARAPPQAARRRRPGRDPPRRRALRAHRAARSRRAAPARARRVAGAPARARSRARRPPRGRPRRARRRSASALLRARAPARGPRGVTPPRGARCEPYHDRVREAVRERPRRRRPRATWHGRLALALEASGDAPSSRRSRSTGATRASSSRAAATRRARRRGRARRSPSTAPRGSTGWRIDLRPRDRRERRALLAKLGDALANAGARPQAGAYLEASRGARAPRDAIERQRRAAESFLRIGVRRRGPRGLRARARAVGMDMPQTPNADPRGVPVPQRRSCACAGSASTSAPRTRSRRRRSRRSTCAGPPRSASDVGDRRPTLHVGPGRPYVDVFRGLHASGLRGGQHRGHRRPTPGERGESLNRDAFRLIVVLRRWHRRRPEGT